MIEIRDRSELPDDTPDLEIPDEIPLDEFGGRDRDLFALGAMIGMMASGTWNMNNHYGEITNPMMIAREAYRVADAMLATATKKPHTKT